MTGTEIRAWLSRYKCINRVGSKGVELRENRSIGAESTVASVGLARVGRRARGKAVGVLGGLIARSVWASQYRVEATP